MTDELTERAEIQAGIREVRIRLEQLVEEMRVMNRKTERGE